MEKREPVYERVRSGDVLGMPLKGSMTVERFHNLYYHIKVGGKAECFERMSMRQRCLFAAYYYGFMGNAKLCNLYKRPVMDVRDYAFAYGDTDYNIAGYTTLNERFNERVNVYSMFSTIAKKFIDSGINTTYNHFSLMNTILDANKSNKVPLYTGVKVSLAQIERLMFMDIEAGELCFRTSARSAWIYINNPRELRGYPSVCDVYVTNHFYHLYLGRIKAYADKKYYTVKFPVRLSVNEEYVIRIISGGKTQYFSKCSTRHFMLAPLGTLAAADRMEYERAKVFKNILERSKLEGSGTVELLSYTMALKS